MAQRGLKLDILIQNISRNLTEYSEVSERLEEKAQVGKTKFHKGQRNRTKEVFNSERILLTKDLIEEIESEIEFEEQELDEYQQKRFGTRGV